jgi:hypothetical protein
MDRFEKDVESLIPIKASEGSILWFPPTPELINALPAHAQDQLRVAGILEPSTQINLSSITIIEGDDSLCNKLNIKRENRAIEYSLDKGIRARLTNAGSETTFIGISMDEYYKLPKEERGDSLAILSFADNPQKNYIYRKKISEPEFIPVLVTDGEGKHWYTNAFDSIEGGLNDSDFAYIKRNHLSLSTYPKYVQWRTKGIQSRLASINYLIPVRVTSFNAKEVAILWYKPTSELLAVLPHPVQQEYENIQNGKTNDSCVYFEVCRNNKGVITELDVFPNPAVSQCTVLMELTSERHITLSITDVSGQLVSTVVGNKYVAKGTESFDIPLNELSDGMYLLVVETDKGERITQRLVVRK